MLTVPKYFYILLTTSTAICPAGQFVQDRNGSFECNNCSFGYYQSEQAMFSCDKCPDNETTEVQGATDMSFCKCECQFKKVYL